MSSPFNFASARKPTVLDEDEWSARLEHIVRRDFYPDLSAMEKTLGQLQTEAVRRGGQRLYGEHDTDGHVLEMEQMPSPAYSSRSEQRPVETRSHSDYGADISSSRKMRLDEFCTRFTSEDNAAFGAIAAREQEQVKEKMVRRGLLKGPEASEPQYLLDTKKVDEEPAAAGKMILRDTDGYGTSGQSSGGIIVSKYVDRNGLYFSPELLEGTSRSETPRQVAGEAKRVNLAATRIQSHNPSSIARDSTGTETNSETTSIDLPGQNLDKATSAKVSHENGGGKGKGREDDDDALINKTPFITWGFLDSTPVRLSDNGNLDFKGEGVNDTPRRSFKMQSTPAREIMTRRLATSGQGKSGRGNSVAPQSPSSARTPSWDSSPTSSPLMTPTQSPSSSSYRRSPSARFENPGKRSNKQMTPLSAVALKLAYEVLSKRRKQSL